MGKYVRDEKEITLEEAILTPYERLSKPKIGNYWIVV